MVYNAAGPDFKPLSDSENQSTRKTYNLGNAYLLFLGAQIPRKNLLRLLQALDLLWQEQPNAPNLLIVGEAMWSNSPVDLAVQGLKNPDKVRFTGRLQRNEVAKVVAAAHALLLPSLFEGFGIPVLEAMACGVPVLTSNCSSLPEVAGDAAVLVDPYSIADIKKGIERVLSDEALRLRCSEQGLKRAAEFSWDRSAEELYAQIEGVFLRADLK
jgi:glycosyltransferase involved in cell wall biosynthesis